MNDFFPNKDIQIGTALSLTMSDKLIKMVKILLIAKIVIENKHRYKIRERRQPKGPKITI